PLLLLPQQLVPGAAVGRRRGDATLGAHAVVEHRQQAVVVVLGDGVVLVIVAAGAAHRQPQEDGGGGRERVVQLVQPALLAPLVVGRRTVAAEARGDQRGGVHGGQLV